MNSLSRSAAGMPGPLSAMTMRATPSGRSCCVSTTVVGAEPGGGGRAVGRRPGADAAERLDRVVDEVDRHAPDLLDIDAHRRQRAVEAPLDPDRAEQPVVERQDR